MFCVVYQLCRVRGSKAVVRQMPHEAGELEPVIHALQAQVNEARCLCFSQGFLLRSWLSDLTHMTTPLIALSPPLPPLCAWCPLES